jgi:membrane protein DedA with SNARE-associated domain
MLIPVDLKLAAVTGAVRHAHHYASVDLAGLGVAAAASWIGVPGPGEPVLIAAAVLAAKHHLPIGWVLLVAWAGATVGGLGGWVVGLRAGRAVLSRPGPLLRLRLRALERGEQVFQRAPVTAVLLAPSWIAGIHRVRAAVFVPVNALGAAAWAGGIGLGAYFVGPPVVDFVGDAGVVLGGLLVLLVVLVLGGEALRRHRATGRSAPSRPT